MTSGGDLAIVATGAATGALGNINLVSTTVSSDNTLLQAKNDINLISAHDYKEWTNNSTNSKTSIGASFNIGDQNGFTLDLGAQIAKGLGNGRELTQVNTTLNTGLLVLKSGQDTTLSGTQVHAETVKADVAGDLIIASRQDEADQKNKHASGGFGASICVPPFCYGSTVNATGNVAASNLNSDYKAVTDQSGIYAGSGGYDIYVGGTTALQGAVIASDAEADKNHLSTGRLITSDIKNTSSISSQSAALSVSYTSADGNPAHSETGGTLPIALSEKDKSTTQSAISAGTITIRDPAGGSDLVGVSRDTTTSNHQLDRPDTEAMQERIELIQSSAQLAGSIINTIAQAKAKAAQQQSQAAVTPEQKLAAALSTQEAASWNVGGDSRMMADIAAGLVAAGLGGAGGATAVGIVANTAGGDIFKKIGDYAELQKAKATDAATKAAWADGGAARVMLHALAGAAMGLSSGNVASGALGAGAAAALMPVIAETLGKNGIVGNGQDALSTLIATGLGATVGSSAGLIGSISGANSATGVEQFNRQLHKTQELPLLKKKAEELEAGGNPQSSASWEDLLTIAAAGNIDAEDAARLKAIVLQSSGSDPESKGLIEDLDRAYQAVGELAAQKIPLTWSDGTQIIADGSPVYAFSSTAAQFNDSTLFNVTETYGPGATYSQWRQYGQAQTAAYGNELANISTMGGNVDAAADRLTVLASKGVSPVTAIDEAVLMAAGGGFGSAVVGTILKLIEQKAAARAMMAAEAAATGDVVGAGAKDIVNATEGIPGRVQSRINVANGRTETTPLRDNGNPVSAGFDHVLDGHFDREISNSRSVFTIAPDELKGILQSSDVVKSPVMALPDGQFVRTVDVGRVIGTTTLKDGGIPTSVIKVFTDKAGNLITTFPVKAGN